jgi:glycosyltransferase involved in cell wall biosynthesis
VKFSVLIPAYQAARFLPKTLESVRAQEHRDWELIVVEDGSRDGTEEIVRAFSEGELRRIEYFNPGQNHGVAAARNLLLERARGDAIAFLDADDWWTPAHLQRACAVLEKGADFAIARLQIFDVDPPAQREIYTPPPEFFADPVRGLFARSAIMTSSSVALRRATAERAGRFDENFCVGEDRDYWLRCALLGARFEDTGEVTCQYAKHSASAMARTLVWAEQDVAFYEKHAGLASVPVSLRHERLAEALSNHGRLLRHAEPRRSAQLLWRAWRLAPGRLSRLAQCLYSLLSPVRSVPPKSGR